jgi:hypothetical protein
MAYFCTVGHQWTRTIQSSKLLREYGLGLEAAIGIEPMNKGFADLCLTTWLRRPERQL